MKFNVQRVLTPAYLTSIALIVVGVLLGLEWYPVAAWLFALSGIALNAMAVSVTEINDAPRAPGTAVRRRPSLPSRRARAEGHDHDVDHGDVHGDVHAEAAPAARHERTEDQTAVEPGAETAATPTVPHSGSSSLRPPRGA